MSTTYTGRQGRKFHCFRFRFKIMGGHTHVRLFAGVEPHLGLCGDLVMRNEEFEDLMARIIGDGNSSRLGVFQFYRDDS